ncbi:fatty acid desaturase [Pararhodobacter oceanensis]|uniref:Fatty acid desaturase n=1 Tax=Pararhodobacter oceanensis TaxID=2172121 RepID=A0A2T8HYD0_9RHOB|nr:fatty acid desaturase [Pararhodobacter oceanensis]PVH30424.1 fatty acid desaturase [Pararhodobacter oceanensis]
MTHSEFLSSLPPETRNALTARSKWRGIAHLAGHTGANLLVGGLILLKVPLWWALLPVQGVLLVALFTLQHECTHKTPFASDWLADRVGQVCGFILVNPFIWFRYFHLAHHRFTNLDGKDPELEGTKPETRRAWAWHVSGFPYWASAARLMAALVTGKFRADYLPARARPQAIREARIMALLYAASALSLLWTPALFWVWLLPVFLAQPVLRLYLLAEHGDCPRVADMFANTRTTFTSAIIRFLAWNMPYHVEHHVFPSVPFHNLPALHDLIRSDLQVTAEGYIAFTRAYLARRS